MASSLLGYETKLEALKPRLTAAIEDWINRNCDSEEWGALGACGDDLAKIMADAAFAVIRASIDVQRYMVREDMVSNNY